MPSTRIEKDSMGTMEVPADALYGASTQRAVLNFPVGERLRKYVLPALEQHHGALEKKAVEFWDVIKIGRTHLMDATPVRLGQEFGGYAKQIEYARLRAGNAIAAIEDLPIGGTAVGT